MRREQLQLDPATSDREQNNMAMEWFADYVKCHGDHMPDVATVWPLLPYCTRKLTIYQTSEREGREF